MKTGQNDSSVILERNEGISNSENRSEENDDEKSVSNGEHDVMAEITPSSSCSDISSATGQDISESKSTKGVQVSIILPFYLCSSHSILRWLVEIAT